MLLLTCHSRVAKYDNVQHSYSRICTFRENAYIIDEKGKTYSVKR